MGHKENKWCELLQHTKETNKLRDYLLQVEADIRNIVGENPLYFYMNYPLEDDIDMVDELLGSRKYILDRTFTYSEEEIKRIKRVNELLFSLTRQMYHRTANLYRTLLKGGRNDMFDDDYEIEGRLDSGVEYDSDEGDFGTVLHLNNDEIYGSDFAYMLYVIHENAQIARCSLKDIETCLISFSEADHPEMTDKELGCDYTMLDDGKSWDECLHEPRFKDICFCHAFHSFFTHHSYSLQDIMRIDSFVVEARLTCQHITDQRGRRYSDILKDN